MSYGRQIIDESLRLYPPAWILSRRTLGEDCLSGHALAPHTDVLISPYFVHRHERHWPAAEMFEPERFGDAPAVARHRCAYLPFGAGPRQCIGERLALLQMVLHLHVVARHFRVRMDPDGPVEMEAAINLRPRHHLQMTIEPR